MERNHICKKCGGIAGWDSYFQSWICTRCGDIERKPITNTDRLRAMSDEELAKFLMRTGACFYDDCDYCNGKDCDKCWLDWLKQEEKNNE